MELQKLFVSIQNTNDTFSYLNDIAETAWFSFTSLEMIWSNPQTSREQFQDYCIGSQAASYLFPILAMLEHKWA